MSKLIPYDLRPASLDSQRLVIRTFANRTKAYGISLFHLSSGGECFILPYSHADDDRFSGLGLWQAYVIAQQWSHAMSRALILLAPGKWYADHP